jgi:transmembrane sensor
VRVDHENHPESLIDGAILGTLSPEHEAELKRHLAECPDCAAELEAVCVFEASVAPGKQDDALNQAAVERALARLQQPETLGARLRRWAGSQSSLRPAAALVGAAAVVAIGFAVIKARQPAPGPLTIAPSPRTLILDDGSEVVPADRTTALQLAEHTPERTTIRLQSGSARFRVHHNSQRLFRVEAGTIEIEDLGTVFRVAHQAGRQVRVAVSEGRVAVLYPAGRLRVELGAGEDRVFSPMPEPSNAIGLTGAASKTAAPVPSAPVARVQSRPRPAADDPAGLLLAADIARRSRHPQVAVAPLRRLVERYPRDPRAPAAAFTLGWVLLTDLGRPREAAAAFAEAERIAQRGALAEDAAARVAESWQKAGDSRRAAEAARHYQQVYPTGRYIPLMRGLVGEN